MHGVIIDDNQETIRLIESRCAVHFPKIIIRGVADNIECGMGLVERYQPCIVFLRVQLPSGKGLDILPQLPASTLFETIVYHVSPDAALEAFQYFVADYLVEPLSVPCLERAIEKAQQRLGLHFPSTPLEHKIQQSNKIALPTSEGFTFVRQQDIVRCEANGNYTQVYLKNAASIFITRTLKHYECLLDSAHFFRAHKSHLVNLNYVQRFIKGRKGAIEMVDGKLIEVSIRKREALLEKLNMAY
ncbi:MAG: LytTR family DNA-binding domain-containing protein [Bacteroidota bacterium]